MTNEQLITLGNFIHEIFIINKDNKKINAKFLYALKRNRDAIVPYLMQLFDKMQPDKPTDELKEKINEYNPLRTKLLMEYVEKDPETNQPIIEGSNYKIPPEKKEELETKMKELSDQYPEVIEFNKFNFMKEKTVLNQLVDGVKFYNIKVEWLPEQDVIAPELMDILHELIGE